jgi:hypothetical protein
MRFGLFLRRESPPKPQPEAVERVKAWASAAAGLPGNAAFAVNEIVCTDPSCPGVETVVLLMQPGRKTRACKVAKALAEVTEQDVREALSPEPNGCHPGRSPRVRPSAGPRINSAKSRDP